MKRMLRKIKVVILILSMLATAITVKSINADVSVLTSELISVEGFQIRTNNPTSSVNFRTVCKAPNIGDTLTVNEVQYEIVDVGTIYVLDTDYSGYCSNAVLNDTYTLLTKANDGNEYEYIGSNYYNGSNRTYGYIATETGVVTSLNQQDPDNTYYVITMQGLDDFKEYTMHVRAFVVGKDFNGNESVIYGAETVSMSIPEVADFLYTNSMTSNYQGHLYLYEKILNAISSSNPYYKSQMLDYGWNDNLYTPMEPETIY